MSCPRLRRYAESPRREDRQRTNSYNRLAREVPRCCRKQLRLFPDDHSIVVTKTAQPQLINARFYGEHHALEHEAVVEGHVNRKVMSAQTESMPRAVTNELRNSGALKDLLCGSIYRPHGAPNDSRLAGRFVCRTRDFKQLGLAP